MSKQTVVGIDGCRKGWVAVVTRSGRFEAAGEYPDVGALAADMPNAGAFAIDIPLCFPVKFPRPAELAAREFLKPKTSALFLIPPLKVLAEESYAKALRRAQAIIGKGISAQAYGLRKKIFELESFLRRTRDRRFFEVHPEVSFRVLAAQMGRSVTAPKRTWNGLVERRELLKLAGLELPREPLQSLASATADDVLDATVAAWTAERIRSGTARPFPSDLKDVKEEYPSGNKGVIWA